MVDYAVGNSNLGRVSSEEMEKIIGRVSDKLRALVDLNDGDPKNDAAAAEILLEGTGEINEGSFVTTEVSLSLLKAVRERLLAYTKDGSLSFEELDVSLKGLGGIINPGLVQDRPGVIDDKGVQNQDFIQYIRGIQQTQSLSR